MTKEELKRLKENALKASFRINGEERQYEFSGLRHLMSTLIREEELDGKQYLVCPTVLIVEGVHNGVFYPATELAKFPDSWNGRPVVVNHPDMNGKPITANSPQIVERQTVGAVYNTRWDDGLKKLIGEVWIDLEKCGKVAVGILDMLRDNQNVEVSTGLFTEGDEVGGTWNGETYLGTVYNYRPDHLALLPNDKGACSWEDGGGMPRVNAQMGVADSQNGLASLVSNLVNGIARCMGMKNNEVSHDMLREKLRTAIGKNVTSGKYNYLWIRDVFDKYVVYAVESTLLSGGNVEVGVTEEKVFKVGYSVDAADAVVLSGDPVEVKVKMDYVPVTNAQQGGEKESEDVTGGKPTANKQEGGRARMNRDMLVNALIASGVKAEADREALLLLPLRR